MLVFGRVLMIVYKTKRRLLDDSCLSDYGDRLSSFFGILLVISLSNTTQTKNKICTCRAIEKALTTIPYLQSCYP